MKPNGQDIGDLRGPLPKEDFSLLEQPLRIRAFDEIPDIMVMDIPPIIWIVPGLISKKSVTLWTGVDGVAKTLLAQGMAVAVGRGDSFLGRRCQPTPVLFLDYENPDHAVRARLELLARGRPITGARFWGTWLQHQPPAIGSDLLLQIAKQIKPLMIFDPFRYAHLAEENDSTEMMSVMQHLRSYAAAGAAVLVLHHPAKTEGSTGRGSSAIRGAVDVAFLQEINDETGLITLRSVKNRFGERFAVTIRPDFDEGTFEVTDSPAFLQRQEELDGLKQIIAESPGISKNRIHEKSGGKRARILRLLQEHDGTLWESRTDGSAIRYFPISQDRFPEQGTTLGTREPVSGNGTGSPVPFPKKGTGGNRVLPNQFPSGSPADDQEDLDVEF